MKVFAKICLLTLAPLVLNGLLIVQLNASSVLVASINNFDNAVKKAHGGDTIVLKNGEWNNVELKFYANGKLNNPIVLIAQTPGKVILSGQSRLQIYGEYLEVNGLDFNSGYTTGSDVIEFRNTTNLMANNCRLTNTRIAYYNPENKHTEYKWVSVYGTNNRIDHCHFEGKNHQGALLVIWLKGLNGTPNYHQIDHNYFANIPVFGDNGAEAIRIGTSDYSMSESRSLVEYNLFESCDGETEIISNKSCFNTYRYNTFRNNDGCLTLRHGNDCEVYSNFFFGGKSGSGGVRIIGERHKVYNNYFQDLDGEDFRAAISVVNGVFNSPINRYFQVKEALIAHNTLVNCNQPINFGSGKNSELSLPPMNCVFSSNLITQTSGKQSVVYTDSPIHMKYHSNIIYDDQIGVSDMGIINVNPLLVHDVIWRLPSSSPAIDAAEISYDFIKKDIDLHNRNARPDIGCDEFSLEKVQNLPLHAENVGVHWEISNSMDSGPTNHLKNKLIR